MASDMNVKVPVSIMVHKIHHIHSNLKYIVYYSLFFMFLIFLICMANVFVLSRLIDIFQLHNPIVHLDSVTITSLETKGVNLTANFDLTFMFDTPYYNNMNTSFNDLKIDVWWSGKEKITLAKMDLPPFALAAHNLTTITSKATVSHEFSNRTDVMNQIVAQRSNGSMEIGVSLFGLISLNDGVSQAMKFNFYPVAVKFPADSKNGTWKWSFTRPIFIFNVL
jgi:hypothetical protein